MQAICNEMKKKDFDHEILKNIQANLDKLRIFKSQGNIIRYHAQQVNRIFDGGRRRNKKSQRSTEIYIKIMNNNIVIDKKLKY